MALTSAVMETQFNESFKARLAAEDDAAIKALRERAFAAFVAKGFPTQQDEDWKYTNVSPIAKERWQTAAAGIELEHEDAGIRAHELFERFRFDRNGFTALNLAMAEIAVIKIAKDTVVDEPIELNFAAAEGTAIFPHVVVIAESGSKATIVESYSSQARSFTNAAVQILVEDNAKLTHYRVQKDSAEAFNYGVMEVTLGKGSYDSTNINLGGAISRHDIELKFTAEGGEALVAHALEAFGRVDIVINNAGVLRDKAFHNMTHEMWDAVHATHLRGAFNVTRPAYGKMRAQGHGRIVMTSSPSGTYGNFGQANYSSAKMGLVGLARTISVEGAKFDIKANVVSPNAATRMTEGLTGELGPHMQPDKVAPVVAYLCHESCPLAGEILTAGAGRIARVFVGEAAGIFNPAASIEDVAAYAARMAQETQYTIPRGVPDASALIAAALKAGA